MTGMGYRVGRKAAVFPRCGFWTVLLFAFMAALYGSPGSAEAKTKGKRAVPTAAAIIVAAESGSVLFDSNSDARTYPASLTKMMTLYLLFEAIQAKQVKLDDPLTVSAHAAVQPATDLGLQTGQRISVEKAILGLIVHSANDVAVVVAEALGGTQSQFAAMMTKKARELGMGSTTYRNASGLPDAGQFTNARDTAILARALITRFPSFYPYFATQSFTYGSRVYTTHNHVVEEYAGADGLKTGYIRASGYNVATSAVRNDRRIIAVVMGGRSAYARDTQMMALLDQGFDLTAKQPKTQIVSTTVAQAPTIASPQTSKTATTIGAPAMLLPPVKAGTAAPLAAPVLATVQVAQAAQERDLAP